MVEFAIAAAVLVVLLVLLLARQRPQGPAPAVEPRGSIDQVAALAREGHRARAISMFRDISGCSITEAHDAVDRLARGEPVEVAPGPTGPPEPAVQDDPEVIRLVDAGELIPAIKRVRERTGLGLKEAKELVDALRARPSPAPPPAVPRDGAAAPDVSDLGAMARAGRLIDAIKLYRERTGVGLREAKDEVERLRDGGA